MSPSDDICTQVRHLVDLLLDGSLPDASARALQRHIEGCVTCSDLVATARGVDRLLATWKAPEPPASLAETVWRRAYRSTARVDCERFARLLPAWIEQELDPLEVARLETHGAECLHCAEEQRAAEEAEQALSLWSAPEPPDGFVDRVLEQLRMAAATSARTPRPGPALRPAAGWRRLAVAAIIVVSLGAAAFLAADLLERIAPPASGPAGSPGGGVATVTAQGSPTPAVVQPSAPDRVTPMPRTVFVTLDSEDLLPPADRFEPYYADPSSAGPQRGKTLRRTARLVALGGR